jgi:hypothetical protein
LVGLIWIAAAGGAGAASIAPSAAVGGPVPLVYDGGFSTWASQPISIPSINDGSPATGVTFVGHDNYLQPNNTPADLGTFYLLTYDLPAGAESFRIDFTASLQYAGGAQEFIVGAIGSDGVLTRDVLFVNNMSQPGTFGLTFFRDHNNGNTTAWAQDWGLNDLQHPDGSIQLLLYGSWVAQIANQGFVTSTLYDVSASVVTVPEPGTAGLLVVGAVAALSLSRRQS